MDKPSPDAIKKQVEDLSGLVDLVAEIWHGRNWVRRLLLLDILLFLTFNPYLKTVLRFIPESWLPRRYELYFWLVIGAVFLLALVIGIRARAAKKQSRAFAERSTIKGLLPFGFADREVFKQLQRDADLIECLQAVTDRNFRFGVLSGESGAGKTSFLQAGLWPTLLGSTRCVYVKFTDLDPAAAIRQAFVEQQIGIPESTPADAPLSTLLAGVAQSDAKPLVLLLDQFEQFFVHFKRESRRRPFIRELNEWYRNGRGLPIKILVCIRGDFLDHLSELQDAMGYSLGPQQKFRLKKFRPEQAAAVFRVIADSETLDRDESFLKELTERELAGADDGLISPVDIQILAWMIAGQAGHEERAFNRTTFQKLGGVEGLLERFLTRALEARETPARRQAATKVLLALTDLDRNARAGALNLDELRQKLGDALADAELKEAVEWLSRVDVRLIAPVKHEGVDGYELAHERLIPALRRIAGKELSEADRASLLLDRRFNEWTGNNRHRRYRLTWRELRSVKKQTPFMQWEPNRGGKESLIAASWRQIRLRFILASLPVLLAIAFASVWYSQWGQLQLIKWEVSEFSSEIKDSSALAQIAKAYTAIGNISKASKIAKKIDENNYDKVIAFVAIAEAEAKLGNGRHVDESLKEAQEVVESFGFSYDGVRALVAVAETAAKLGKNDQTADLLKKAQKNAYLFEYGTREPEEKALVVLAKAAAKLGYKDLAYDSLTRSLHAVQRNQSWGFHKALHIRAITATTIKIDDKERAIELLNLCLQVTKSNIEKDYQNDALSAIVRAATRLDDEKQIGNLLHQVLQAAKEVASEDRGEPALEVIIKVTDKLSDSEQWSNLLKQILQVVEGLASDRLKTTFLYRIVEVAPKFDDKERVENILEQVGQIAEKITDESEKAPVFDEIRRAKLRLSNKEIFDRWKRTEVVEDQVLEEMAWISYETYRDFNDPESHVEAVAMLEDKEKALYSLKQFEIGTESYRIEDAKVRVLRSIAKTVTKFGDFRWGRAIASKHLSRADEAKTLALILEIWAKSKNPRLADEVSKEEQ